MAAVMLLGWALTSPSVEPGAPWFGVLQADPGRSVEDFRAGFRLATLELAWDRYEPRPGDFDEGYVREVRARATAMRSAGMQLVLDLGLQYPPRWAFERPHSRFLNQYGDAFAQERNPGANGLNAVFNESVRELQAAYVAAVFRDLGTEFFAVRLGWCYYGELQYPSPAFRGRKNCYWVYDDIAQGKAPGLPAGLKPCPVPGWKPGDRGPRHRSAAMFADWCLDSLKEYQDWQIKTVRRHYGGRLAVLYPSWGLRPGQIEKAVEEDLKGATAPERNGELQRGGDFDRCVGGIRDAGVIPYTTWLDASPESANDLAGDPSTWCPAHYLSKLARAHPLRLQVWGENAGPSDVRAMRLCFQRMRQYGLIGFFWAFESHLWDGKPPHATLGDFARFVHQSEAGEVP